MSLGNQPKLQLFLDRLVSRSVLSQAEQQAILDLPNQKADVAANRDIVRVGDDIDHACVVVDGIVGRFGQNMDGERQITGVHIAGDMANLQSVVEPRATTALQALSAATLLRIPHRALRAAAATYPAIAEAFWRDCMVDAAIASQWAVNLGCRNAKTRIAHLLCEAAVRFKVDGRAKASYDFPLTQAHLGDATGLTAVHVNRTLKALREDGAVSVSGRTVQILDWDALVRTGEFDPTYLQANLKPEERIRIVAI